MPAAIPKLGYQNVLNNMSKLSVKYRLSARLCPSGIVALIVICVVTDGLEYIAILVDTQRAVYL